MAKSSIPRHPDRSTRFKFLHLESDFIQPAPTFSQSVRLIDFSLSQFFSTLAIIKSVTHSPQKAKDAFGRGR